MAELKTRETKASVEVFLNKIKNEDTRADCYTIVKMMKAATKAEPKMWGPAIVGFGSHRLKYASGRELDWPLAAFSPRKTDLTLYVLNGSDKEESLLKKLGKYKRGKICLYVRSLSDIDTKVLKDLITESVKTAKRAGQ